MRHSFMSRLPLWVAVLASVVIHLGAVYAWQQRTITVPSALAVQTVTVELLALEPPSGVEQQSAPLVPPADSQPLSESKPLPDEEAVSEKPEVVKKPTKPPVLKTPTVAEKMKEQVPTQAVASADNPTPAAAPAPVPVSAARYDAGYLRNPPPAYPPLSRRLGEEGSVLLRVQVTSEGLPSVVEIEKSSGVDRLDQAARKSVLRWRFVPARQGDLAVASWVDVPIQFNLKE